MERKEQFKKNAAPANTSRTQETTSPLVIYNASTLESSSIETDDILEAYNTYATPKTKRAVKRSDAGSTPKLGPQSQRLQGTPGRSPSTVFSPTSYSEHFSEPSQRYSTRNNAGEVRLHFGPNSKTSTWKPLPGSSFYPKIRPYNPDAHMKADARYMFEKTTEEIIMRDEQTNYLAHQIMQKYSLADPEPCAVPSQESMITYGRVITQKLTTGVKCVCLQGSRALSSGKVVDLELGQVETSLFPGQVCVVKATNPTGKKLVAEKVYTSAALPLPSCAAHFGPKEGPLQLVVAAGPFTQLDTLDYQPLEDLINYTLEHKPHVLILIGPFIDRYHPYIQAGKLAETFHSMFDTMLGQLKMQHQTQVVLIPSWLDSHSHPIYPTLPYSIDNPPKNVHFFSDPSTISIQGLVIGVTSLDVIKDMGANEVYSGNAGLRLHRLASHVLHQQCFYPIYPSTMNVDAELFNDYAHLEVTPHILILASELRHFAFMCEGCLFLNPERLSRGMVGGTFTRIEVPPPTSEDPNDFVNNISCNVVTI